MVRERIDELSVAFKNFIRELPPPSRVIVASREEDLLDPLDGKEKRFHRFSVQPLTKEEISLYSENVAHFRTLSDILDTLSHSL